MKNGNRRIISWRTAMVLVITSLITGVACKTIQPDFVRDTEDNLVPNLAKCARKNFPEFAQDYVHEARVATRVSVDKQGVVLSVEPLTVTFPPHVDKKTAKMLTPVFKSSAVLSLRGQECPVGFAGNEPQPYSMDFLLEYRFVTRNYISVDTSPIEPTGDVQPWR